jgi:hypothetical protein
MALGEVVAPDERENLAMNLVRIFMCRHSILSLLKTLTTHEINNTLDAGKYLLYMMFQVIHHIVYRNHIPIKLSGFQGC